MRHHHPDYGLPLYPFQLNDNGPRYSIPTLVLTESVSQFHLQGSWQMTQRQADAFVRRHESTSTMALQQLAKLPVHTEIASLVLYGRCQASSGPHARSRKGESRRTLSEPFSPFESKLRYNPPMQGMPWSTIALGSLLLISARLIGGQDVQSPQPEKSKPPVKIEPRGRILGIGGVFFKSANRDQMREWYSKHLGLADKGQGAMLPWREHNDPQKEHVTVWTVFSASTHYIPATQPFM